MPKILPWCSNKRAFSEAYYTILKYKCCTILMVIWLVIFWTGRRSELAGGGYAVSRCNERYLHSCRERVRRASQCSCLTSEVWGWQPPVRTLGVHGACGAWLGRLPADICQCPVLVEKIFEVWFLARLAFLMSSWLS